MLETTQTPSTPAQTFTFQFQGNGKEYFRIWIVNIGLTILTLGLYSAWAKVRMRRYIYNHMYLNGQSFDYHADPIKILKGRIVLALLTGSFALVGVSLVFLIVPLIFFCAMPYLIVRGAIFNFSNTSYRGVRFGFQKAYAESYITWLKGLAIAFFTLGIGAVAVNFRWRKFIIDHLALGKTRFTQGGTGFDFWKKMVKEPFLYGLAFGVVFMILVMGLAFSGLLTKPEAEGTSMVFYVIGAIPYLFYGFIFVIYQVRSAAYYAYHMKGEGGVGFNCRLELWDTFLLYAESALLLVISLGLAWPWVRVNILKYKAERFDVVTTPEFFNSLEQAKVESASAFGEEVASFVDFDIGF